jgi:hypothetical protein
MAAINRVKARPASPGGYEVNDSGTYTEAVVAGDQLIINGVSANGQKTWGKAGLAVKEGHGIALLDGYLGGVADVGIQGEMDGYSGLTPGQDLYPSTATAGGIDTTAVAAATVRVRAVSDTRIRYSYV